ncbi:NAD(P)/FAD-dependent oxidoreductase [Sulfobacillus harzensis]|uniref:FAD-dependent oxidoreductase n=1 Tax=Sulfobacillus harzensis TaxID=2729629 RepID=A0A7Y0Q2R3_9FIRM|nr:FAD-dependent oxidoreductase [Sulfobacillus harzensis]NMP21424.1 FAD-dependent oxidoreductase [Sulfobacillus harzensis]
MSQIEVVIIGSGPAGLSAALRLGQSGVATVIVDEYPRPGGRLLGQLYRRGRFWWNGRAEAEKLIAAVRQCPSVQWRLGTSVVALTPNQGGWRVSLSGSESVDGVAAVLIATGAAEVPVPVKNWNRPGVMTIGAAQVMANVYRVRPGQRGIVVGGGPLAFAIAQELSWAGVELTGIVMPPPGLPAPSTLTPYAQWRSIGALSHLAPWWARPLVPLLKDDGRIPELMARIPAAGIGVAGTRLKPNVAAVEILGEDRVEGIRLQRLSREGRLVGQPWIESVDFVLLSGGLRPIPDLFHVVGARIRRSDEGIYDVPVFGPLGETTAPGVFGAGNALGVEGAPVAMAQGTGAALGILRYLHREGDHWGDEVSEHARELRRVRTDAPLVFSHEWSRIHEDIAQQWQQVEGGR